MKNSLFIILFNEATGCVSSLKNISDPHSMNWCAESESWGEIFMKEYYHTPDGMKYLEGMKLLSFQSDESSCCSEYSNGRISVNVLRKFTPEGNFSESYIIKNITETVFCINRDNFGIKLPFNDRYTTAKECMTSHCHTHIWCAHNVAWINALRMGESDCNLGLILTDGAIDCYSQTDCKSNTRGVFLLHPESMMLKSGEEYRIGWELFWHKGKEDFLEKINSYENNIFIKAKHFTVFKNETMDFTLTTAKNDRVEVFLNGDPVPVTFVNGVNHVSIKPKKPGEHRFVIKDGETVTWADFIVKEEFGKLLEKRAHFIVENQQCLDKESPLYGAFLIYDNENKSQFFNDFFHDHNACRERINMGLVLLKYLQVKDDAQIRKAIDLYIDFIFREIFDESTGEVFNTIGKNQNLIRPYNAPGIMLLLTEMYFLTKEKRFLKSVLRLAQRYYSIGGEKCYSNAIAVEKITRAFDEAGMKNEGETMQCFFKMHAENVMRNGIDYPEHEVNYEQTIVTPAVSILSECGLLTGDPDYADKVKQHLSCLERFNGFQPSFHLNEIAIRFWDDYWFGKRKLFGDTMPHHLSCLTARAYYNYSRLSGKTEYLQKAEECLRNCLCLIGDDGTGAAAYVYPYTTDGNRGEFYDPFANDQDLSLYEAMYMSDLVPSFRTKE